MCVIQLSYRLTSCGPVCQLVAQNTTDYEPRLDRVAGNSPLTQLRAEGANVSELIQKSPNANVNEFKGTVHPRNDDENEIS